MRILTTSEDDQDKAIDYGVEILKDDMIKYKWAKKRDAMLKDKIDVASFLGWLIENYPESKKIITKDKDYQYRFK